MQSSKEKLNNLLGISSDQSIDDFLDDIKTSVDDVSDEIKANVAKVDADLATLSSASFLTDLSKTDQINAGIMSTLGEIKELIDISKNVIKHVYQSIVTSELVDAELIQAAAKIIESSHINIQDYLDIYKSRIQFYDKIRFEMFKYQHDLEKMKLKQQFDLEKAASKAKDGATDLNEGGDFSWNQEFVIKTMNDNEKQKLEK